MASDAAKLLLIKDAVDDAEFAVVEVKILVLREFVAWKRLDLGWS